jgi:hypothetical protein
MPNADESRDFFIVELLPRVMAAVAATFVRSVEGMPPPTATIKRQSGVRVNM